MADSDKLRALREELAELKASYSEYEIMLVAADSDYDKGYILSILNEKFGKTIEEFADVIG